ncbi:MAG: ABC transporter ATP-binding protein [Desulfuromonadaceae bacterium]|nr:ABC transporter ATP-binding protein [Desulfuromonadaceae bacterium]
MISPIPFFDQLWPWLKRYRRALLWGSLWLLLSNGFILALPQLMRLAVAAIEAHNAEDLIFYALLMVVLTLAGSASRVRSRLYFLHTGRRVEVDLRRAMFERLLGCDAPFFDRHHTGDLISRLTNDLTNVRMVAGFGVLSLVNALVVYSMTLGWMLWLSPRLTLVALLPFPLMVLAIKAISRHVLAYSARVQDQLGTLSAYIDETLSGQRSLRSAGFDSARQQAFDALNATYLDDALALARVRALILPVMSVVTPSGMLLVLYFGGRQIVAGTLQLGDLVAFNAYLVQLAMPTLIFGWILTLIQRAIAAMERMSLLLELPPLPVALPAPDNAHCGPAIRLRQLRFAYPSQPDKVVLGPLSLEIAAGGFIGLVGPVASGKSTLIQLLSGRYPLSPGQLEIDGLDLSEIAAALYRQRLSAVLQEGRLFSGPLVDNLRFGAPQLSDAELEQLLERVCLSEEVRHFTAGLATPIGEGGLTLSGGQRQRTAIGRALARNGGLWLLDDPFSHLDVHTAHVLWQQLRPLLQGRTVLFAASRLALLQEADWIVCLEAGQILEQGTHARLVEQDGYYARRFRQERLAQELEAL